MYHQLRQLEATASSNNSCGPSCCGRSTQSHVESIYLILLSALVPFKAHLALFMSADALLVIPLLCNERRATRGPASGSPGGPVAPLACQATISQSKEPPGQVETGRATPFNARGRQPRGPRPPAPLAPAALRRAAAVVGARDQAGEKTERGRRRPWSGRAPRQGLPRVELAAGGGSREGAAASRSPPRGTGC